ncbi:hypothetical protein O181_105503 [Austropuccinia psidii MF-1]|uniref:Uncharacterized protein n=1 Tax=Austropuccinia psidii MF-1 TaxID=1389203 RepID=A0A9Q3PL22_9BASI|nr:hypothetical protein [Austropuccinia psidii MF-1]
MSLYLDVERPYPPILRRYLYSESLENSKEIEKNANKLLDMDVIGKMGDNEIVEVTMPILITWNYEASRLCGDFRALEHYTKADRYPIIRITYALDNLEKTEYITNIDFMKGFHQNEVNQNHMQNRYI